jgi:hypothetical protein
MSIAPRLGAAARPPRFLSNRRDKAKDSGVALR